MKLPEILYTIAKGIDKEGGIPILVGGAVRDYLLGMENKDLDVEVFGMTFNHLINTLKKYGKVSIVGKAFGVLKLSIQGHHFDFSLPRNDLKTGAGHRGFRIRTNPEMTFKEAASRRDFTINAMGFNLITREIIDEFDGRNDLRNRVLRVVDPNTFTEDPLRVLRGIQFAARLRLRIPDSTKNILIHLVDSLEELPKERVFTEIKKLLLKARNPGIGLEIADAIGVVKKLFPELDLLQTIPLNASWQPGKSSWQHMIDTVNEAARLRVGEEFYDLCIMLAALCYQFPGLNQKEVSKHEIPCQYRNSFPITVTKRFLCRICNEVKLIETVDRLVQHQSILQRLINAKQIKNGDIRRLALQVDIPMLLRVARAEFFARFEENQKPSEFSPGQAVLDKYHALKLWSRDNMQPLLLGRHLIELGLKPGPAFGRLLNEAYQKQLDDEFLTLDDALYWAEGEIAKLPSGF